MPTRRLLGLAAVAVAGFAAAAILLPHSASELRELVSDVGPAAPLAALGAWVLLTPAAFPLPILASASGLAFGAAGGAALTVCGAVAGGLAAFALARTAAHDSVERAVHRRPLLARLHHLIEQRGFASVLAARLMPALPVAPVHYVSGVTPVRVGAFAGAMAVGAMLRLAPYALLGEGVASGSTTSLVIGGASMAIGATTALLLVRYLRRLGPATA